jgi:hypothetical protein
VLAVFVTFACGVVAATADAAVVVRIIAGALFLFGVYLLLDAVVLAASWRLTSDALKIPTLASRQRQVPVGADLVVTPTGQWFGTIVISGERGARTLRVNPLVHPADLHAWFADIAGEPSIG